MDCSVVIPAYNVEVFVARAIQSALDQTEKPADIIVVDDGSTDGTAAVVRSFGGIVRYCHQRNGGASAARNRGIREARGAFIALLDADDEWLPSHLAVAAQVFEKHPELAWYCAGNRVQYRDGRSRDRRAPPETLIDNCYLRDYFAAAAQGTSFHTSTMVVRRGVFEEAGLFDPQFRVGEDLDMFFRIALCYPRVGYGNEVEVIYRLREGSLTTLGLGSVEKFVARIRHDEKLAAARGAEAAQRAQPLILAWLVQAVRQAVIQGQRQVLRNTKRDYGRRLPVRWRILGLACRWTPAPLWCLLIRAARGFKGITRDC